ncbi:acyltransferase family protein [Thalassotalea piscium]|uniref:Peptidoglycan/LPS O-acetylase OafA/YrhL n=1 Tax=Thalassotalea piscium TaxID=1230533 RepID=A0A7X0NEJ7_9GAMM|nr:acyltransferase family protein [Thalassotalea piscium]MBB6541928.1 peptidoglycan/LPS O-acetylase OafA/YrhL [Thalassotalea piscium]
MNYRIDIDGLRTIAVALVILNHAGFSAFSGGFVGVDVFFVISGFLITAIIFPQIIAKTFSIKTFLSRRIKRLMPVLLFVVLITAIVFSFIMLPEDLMRFYRSIIWVVLYGANFFFWKAYGGYFDGGSQEAPLLHTWSLAIEEQYYLLWPLMLLFAVKFLGGKVTAYLSVVLLVFATIFSQWGTEFTIGAAYYLLPTRFFELLLGSCLAIFWHKLPKLNTLASHVLSLIGLALIISSALLLSEHSQFPGYNALYPTLGTALLIYSVGGVVNNILSYKPIVYTGNISYSLYLWHWPVLVLLRYTAIELTLPTQLFAIFLTYILSILSYKYIEQPFRLIKVTTFGRVASTMYLIPAALLISIALLGINSNGYPSRFSPEVIKMDNALNSFASKSRVGCHAAFRNSEDLPNKKCFFGEEEAPQGSFFIFGDSHANHLVPFFTILAKEANYKGQDYTLDRCLPVMDLNWGSNLHMAEKCRQRNHTAQLHIEQQKFDFVVMAASWPHFTTQRIFTNGPVTDNQIKKTLVKEKLASTLKVIIRSGAVPIFIEDTPTLLGKSPKCSLKKELFNSALQCDIKRLENIMFNEILAELKPIFPSLIIMKPHTLYCQGENCSMSFKELPLYRDDDHLNEEGAKLLAEEYLIQRGNPFK